MRVLKYAKIDMKYNIDEKILIGGVMPNVYVNSIDISNGSNKPSGKRNNPHVASRRNYYSKSQDINNSLSVSLNMSVKLTQAQQNAFAGNTDYYKIMVIQCLKKDVHDKILSNPYDFFTKISYNIGERDFEGGAIKTKIIPIDYPRDNYTFDAGSGDKLVTNVNFQCNFDVEDSEGGNKVNFLSYHAFCYYDSYARMRNDGILINQNAITRGLSVCGRVSSERIFENQKTIKNSIAFKDNQNNFWLGRVHQMSDGSWMKNSYHSANDEAISKILVHNTKLRDHRVHDVIAGIGVDSLSKEEFKLKNDKIIDELRKDSNLDLIKENPVLFSEMYLSRDSTNNGRFLFSFNMEEAILSTTDIPVLLRNMKRADPQAYRSVFQKAKITNLSVTRKRVKKNQTITSNTNFVDVDNEQESVIIAQGKDAGGTSKTFHSQLESTLRTDPTGTTKRQKVFGTIHEINLNTKLQNSLIRHFTGLDYDVATQGVGEYKYYVNVEIENPVASVLDSLSRSLQSTIEGSVIAPGLEEYYRDSLSREEFTNSFTGDFTTEFLKFYNSKYNTGDTQNYAQTNSNLVFRAVSLITKTVFYLSGNVRNFNMTEMDVLYYLTNISSPSTGSSDGVNKLIQLAKSLLEKIRMIMKKNSSFTRFREDARDNVDSSNSSTQNSSEYRKYDFSHSFGNTFNLSDPQGVGYDYLFTDLNSTEKNKDGLTILDVATLNERFKMETNKYFKEGSLDISIKDENNQIFNEGDSIDNSKYSYLTVSNAYVKDSKEFIAYSNVRSAMNNPCSSDLNKLYTAVQQYVNSKNIPNSGKIGNSQNSESQRLLENLFNEKNTSFASQREQRKLQKSTQNSKTVSVFSNDSKASNIDENERLFNLTEKEIPKKVFDILDKNMNKEFNDNSNSISFYFVNDPCGGQTFKRQLLSDLEDTTKKVKDTESRRINFAPNQIKSLMLSLNNSEVVYNNTVFDSVGRYIDDSTDVMRDPNNLGFFHYNYRNLRQIEVFDGYGQFSSNRTSVRSPNWRPMTKRDLDSLSSGGALFCRHIQYQNTDYGIGSTVKSSFPVFNDHFLLATNRQTQGTRGDNVNTTLTIRDISNSNGNTNYNSNTLGAVINNFVSQRVKTTDLYQSKNMDPVRNEFISTDIVIKKIPISSLQLAELDLQSVFATEDNKALESYVRNLGLGRLVNRKNPGRPSVEAGSRLARNIGTTSEAQTATQQTTGTNVSTSTGGGTSTY
jgi:hypothetical protein